MCIVANPCPTSEQLRQFRDGKLTDFDRSAVNAHVQTCRTCQQTVSDLGQDEAGATVIAPRPLAEPASKPEALPDELLNHLE